MKKIINLKLLKTFLAFQKSKKGNYNRLIISLTLATTTPVLNFVIAPYFYAKFVSSLEHRVISNVISWQDAIASGVVMYMVTILVACLIQVAHSFSVAYLESKAMHDMDNTTSKHIFWLSFDYFKNILTSSLVKKQTKFSGLYERLFDMICWEIIPIIVVILGAILVMCMFSWILGVVMIAYIAIFIAFVVIKSKQAHPIEKDFIETDTELNGIIGDQITNMQTVKSFGRDNDEHNKYVQLNEVRTAKRLNLWNKDQTNRAISSGIITFINLLLVYLCYLLWINGNLDLGGVVLIIGFSSRVADRIWQTGNIIKSLRTITTDANEMIEVLDVQPTVVDVEHPVPCDIRYGHICINDISFHYPDSETNVFENFSLEIPAGQKVGIVGESGSGKSTLIHLMMRMVDIQSGEITIDGIPIHMVRQHELRQSMSIVPQDTILFHRTVRENIAYAKPDATDEEVVTAAMKAQAHEFITALKSDGRTGYDVKVGERGIKLSGGQRQRIGLARAFLQHKPLLILDEATSSLDSISEKKIQKGLKKLLHEQSTMIVIAHRLSTVNKLDRIIVMDKGQIVQDGPPDVLYAIIDGPYRRLVDAQQLVTNEETI